MPPWYLEKGCCICVDLFRWDTTSSGSNGSRGVYEHLITVGFMVKWDTTQKKLRCHPGYTVVLGVPGGAFIKNEMKLYYVDPYMNSLIASTNLRNIRFLLSLLLVCIPYFKLKGRVRLYNVMSHMFLSYSISFIKI